MRLIDGALCLCFKNGSLRFYGTSLNLLAQYTPQRGDDMKEPRDVAETHEGQVLVAARNGLYLFDNCEGMHADQFWYAAYDKALFCCFVGGSTR